MKMNGSSMKGGKTHHHSASLGKKPGREKRTKEKRGRSNKDE